MRNEIIQQTINNLGGVIIILLEIGGAVIIAGLLTIIAVEIIKAAQRELKGVRKK